MVLVVVGVEAAVFTGGLVVIVALAVAVITDRTGDANGAALTTIELVAIQVDAGFAARVVVTDALGSFALFFRATRLIAAAAVRWIGLGIHAGVVAGEQQLTAPGQAFALGTILFARRVAVATVVRVGGRIDASVSAGGLALLAQEAALAGHAGPIPGARVVARTTVLLRAARVDAKIIADHVGRRTLCVAHPVDTKLVVEARDPARTTMLEAGVRVDADAIAEPLEAETVDHARAVFTDFVIQARLPTTAAMLDVQINADTLAVADGLRGIGAQIGLAVGILTVREVGVRFSTTDRRRNQREQDEPQL